MQIKLSKGHSIELPDNDTRLVSVEVTPYTEHFDDDYTEAGLEYTAVYRMLLTPNVKLVEEDKAEQSLYSY